MPKWDIPNWNFYFVFYILHLVSCNKIYLFYRRVESQIENQVEKMNIDLNNSRTLTTLVIVVLILFAIVYVCTNRDRIGWDEEFTNYPVAVGDVVQLQGGLNNIQVGSNNTPLPTSINNLIQQSISNLVPALTIVSYFGNVAPTGWQLCDGNLLTDTNGIPVGISNASGYINTPNLQGRVIVGTAVPNTALKDQNGNALKTYNLGDYSGEEQHTLGINEMPPHDHNIFFTFYGGSGWGGGLRCDGGANSPGKATNQMQGNGAPHNIMQPYYVLSYIIKQPIGNPNNTPIKLAAPIAKANSS
jgi:microcystin-dependent protein